MKNICSLFLVVLLSLPAAAAASFESAQAAAGQAFQNLPRIPAVFRKGAPVRTMQGAPAAQAPRAELAKARVVPVYGMLHLSGTGFIPNIPGYANVSLRGTTEFSDAAGQLRSRVTWITEMVDVYVTNQNQFVSGWVRPHAQVHFYKDGQYVGSAWIQGDIQVQGWANGNWLNLSGFGQLAGDLILDR